jgi:RNA polymerase sigma-70 factor (ECF subfamily)
LHASAVTAGRQGAEIWAALPGIAFATVADVAQSSPSPALGFERQTFDEIYAMTWRLVWSSARNQGVPPSAIPDVVQDVFVAVYRQLDKFAGQCSHQTWVLAILRNVVSNYHRTRRRKGAGHAVSSAVDDPEWLIDDRDFFELLSEREAGRIVCELAGKLGDKHCPLFLMAELEGMTAVEIAARTSVKMNTVNSRLRAARVEFSRLVDSFRRAPQRHALAQ